MFKYLIATSNGEFNWLALFMLITFFAIFAVVIIMLFVQSKKHIDHMAHLPLENENKFTGNEEN
jgi:hypothetical protein